MPHIGQEYWKVLRQLNANDYLLINGTGGETVKSIRIWIMLFLAVLLGCACSHSAPSSAAAMGAPCTVEMVDVGQGLCILVEMDGHYLLYDGGGRETSSRVVRHLRDLCINSLDLMIASHYDEDHISGLIGVLSDIQVDRVIAPVYESDTRIYWSFQDSISDSRAVLLSPCPGDVYSLGSGEIMILGPYFEECENENNLSVAVLLTYGKIRCLITGDSETEEEQQMTASGMDLSADIYVAGHHGSASSSSRAFIDAVHPKYVFISCGADNPYGHPASRTMKTLRNIGAEVFRSDLQGSVTAYTDGETLWFSAEPCSDWTPGIINEQVSFTPEKDSYVLNQRTMRFHRPECESVIKMYPENRVFTEDSRENLIARGYQPCGVCNP